MLGDTDGLIPKNTFNEGEDNGRVDRARSTIIVVRLYAQAVAHTDCEV